MARSASAPREHDADAVVIGSGFGGAVAACRLAEAGYRVIVLERGRRWTPDTFPREAGDPWIWSQDDPVALHGWFDARFFPRMIVVTGAGVGGGSLVYANVSVEADPSMFAAGWPPELTYGELATPYRRVGEMLDVQTVPPSQWPARTHLMREAANATGNEERFVELPLAVSFDPGNGSESRRFTNAHGVEQGTCVHLGLCDVGCPVNARNTLDLNYLAVAERLGAEVRPLHVARHVEPIHDGYRVHLERVVGDRLVASSVTARIAILAAGSLGSTELLLRSRDVSRTLPNLPRGLGRGWSSNGDFLTLAVHDERLVSPTIGPTITSAIDFRDGSQGGVPFFVEDGGFPDVFGDWVAETVPRWSLRPSARRSRRALRTVRSRPDLLPHLMPWFAQGRDAGDGRLRLRRRWWLFGRKRLHLDWDPKASRPTIAAIAAMHDRLARATGGDVLPAPLWTLGGYLITPHPLGGCNMGSGPDSVTDHRGEVRGHRNLYVMDGAIVPEAIGANPSRTIAALAERASALLIAEGR
jgi:cholesterol oxidase